MTVRCRLRLQKVALYSGKSGTLRLQKSRFADANKPLLQTPWSLPPHTQQHNVREKEDLAVVARIRKITYFILNKKIIHGVKALTVTKFIFSVYFAT